MRNSKEKLKGDVNSNKKSIIAIVCFLVYLAVGLSLYITVSAFSLHWFIFGLFAILIPSGMTCGYDLLFKVVKPNDKQKAYAVKVIINNTLFYWLADCVYMAIFNGWTTWIYILGIIFIILVLLTLANAFLSKRKRNAVINFFNAIDLVLGLAATVYLIYIIPENLQNLQTIITTIVAAVYGGLLTLVGVAWTIKKADNDRREEEKKKYRPMMVFYKTKCEPNYIIVGDEFSLPIRVSFEKYTTFCFSYKINDFVIRNLDFSSLFIEGMIINEKYVLYRTANLFVEKDKYILFQFYSKNLFTKFKIERIGILVKDILDNEYVFDLGLNFEKKDLFTEVNITGSKKLLEYKGEQ